ncbi:hypothetical protein KCP73_21265 [Salmonella enterica subsp. enterica]|nr:hypothetical protein KCP73_21265 [Salmonella enterica subsp. enterica]
MATPSINSPECKHIGVSVDRAVRRSHAASERFSALQWTPHAVFVVGLLVLYRFTLCRRQLKASGFCGLILVHN